MRAFESRKKINPEFKVEILAERREQREIHGEREGRWYVPVKCIYI